MTHMRHLACGPGNPSLRLSLNLCLKSALQAPPQTYRLRTSEPHGRGSVCRKLVGESFTSESVGTTGLTRPPGSPSSGTLGASLPRRQASGWGHGSLEPSEWSGVGAGQGEAASLPREVLTAALVSACRGVREGGRRQSRTQEHARREGESDWRERPGRLRGRQTANVEGREDGAGERDQKTEGTTRQESLPSARPSNPTPSSEGQTRPDQHPTSRVAPPHASHPLPSCQALRAVPSGWLRAVPGEAPRGAHTVVGGGGGGTE